jgi:hypothetical protein
MNAHLEHFARRVADAPDFLACPLNEYARSERIGDVELAARLGCTVETLTHLRLCRTPREEALQFWQDVEQIAQRFSVPGDVLAEVVRRGQSLRRLRNASDKRSEHGFLMAARDDAREDKPPQGAG